MIQLRQLIFSGSILAVTLLPAAVAGQESLDRYTTSNGLVINEDDSITIGVGSFPSGAYRHIFMSSLIAPLNETNIEYCRTSFGLQPGQEGVTVPVKKMKRANDKVYLFVPLGGSTPFIIEIEEAIATCEVAFCRPGGYLNQQEFEKLMLMNAAFNNGNLPEDRFYRLRGEFLEVTPEPEHLE